MRKRHAPSQEKIYLTVGFGFPAGVSWSVLLVP